MGSELKEALDRGASALAASSAPASELHREASVQLDIELDGGEGVTPVHCSQDERRGKAEDDGALRMLRLQAGDNGGVDAAAVPVFVDGGEEEG